MKFKLKIKDKHSDYEWEETYNSHDLYLVVGQRRARREFFPLKADTKEEFERFGRALIANYNKHNARRNHRELVGVVMIDE